MGQAAHDKLKEAIIETKNIRFEQFHSGVNTLIGINAFMNEFDSPKAEWVESPTFLELPYLILEKIAV